MILVNFFFSTFRALQRTISSTLLIRKRLKGTVVNRVCPTLFNGGSIKIKTTVPLTRKLRPETTQLQGELFV